MKYYCETCDGTGTINDACEDEGTTGECLNCDGTGYVETCISLIKFGAGIRHRKELLEIQHEARLVVIDCGKMLAYNSTHWQSYVSQLEKTIAALENQAVKLLP